MADETVYYQDIESFKSNFILKNDLFILHQNIRSINKNLDVLLVFLSSIHVKPDVIVLTEAWLREGDDRLYTIDGYCSLSVVSATRCGGIVVFYSTDKITACHSRQSTVFGADSLLLDIKVRNDNSTISLFAIYRRHGYPFNDFIDSFQHNLSKIKNKFVICIGDFNLDINTNSEYSDKYSEVYSGLGFNNLMTGSIYTRVTETSSSCIDHILYRNNRPLNIRPFVIDSFITDHRSIGLTIGYPTHLSDIKDPHVTYVTDYDRVNSILENEAWTTVYSANNVSNAFNCFVDILRSAVNLSKKQLPNNKNKMRKLKPWISNGLCIAIKHRDKMWKKVKTHPNDIILMQRYKSFKSKIERWVKEAKLNYYTQLFEKNRNNNKAQWKIINELSGNKRCASNEIKIRVNNDLICDQKLVADEFNMFFSNVSSSLSLSMPDVLTDHFNLNRMFFMRKTIKNSVFLYPVTEIELNNLILKLERNKAPGSDGVDSVLVKNISKHIIPVLVYIFNKSLSEGEFPKSLKLAHVVPIFKKGSEELLTNYRPISLLSVFSKLLEKIMKIRLLDFLNSVHFFSNSQFGFREGMNTEAALNRFIGELHNHINDNNFVTGIFLDLQKAFDTVDHTILLFKLHQSGIRGGVLNWFKSYLSGREQYVSIGSSKSSIREIKSGVPQGSVLGPILFLIFVNDLYNGPLKGHITAFADDTAISYAAITINELKLNIEHDMRWLWLWFSCNKLYVNVQKSCLVNFSYFRSFNFNNPIKFHSYNCTDTILCSCTSFPQSTCVKYLGLLIDERLNWKEHINYLKNYLLMFLRKFYYLRLLCPDQVLCQVYHAFVNSKLDYGIAFWMSTYITYYKRLLTIQKSYIRTICKVRRRTESYPLFKKLNILPLRYQFAFKVLLLFYKISGNFGVTIDRLNIRRNTRFADRIRLPRANTSFFQKTYVFLGPKLFNEIDRSRLNLRSDYLLKKSLKIFLIDLPTDDFDRLFDIIQ